MQVILSANSTGGQRHEAEDALAQQPLHSRGVHPSDDEEGSEGRQRHRRKLRIQKMKVLEYYAHERSKVMVLARGLVLCRLLGAPRGALGL